MTDNVAGALCYLIAPFTGIIFLLLAPYNTNRRVRFHAWQSIFFGLAAFIIDWVLRILIWSVLHLSFIGFGLISLVNIGWFVLWLVLLVSTYNGKTIRLPVIGDLAEKQA